MTYEIQNLQFTTVRHLTEFDNKTMPARCSKDSCGFIDVKSHLLMIWCTTFPSLTRCKDIRNESFCMVMSLGVLGMQMTSKLTCVESLDGSWRCWRCLTSSLNFSTKSHERIYDKWKTCWSMIATLAMRFKELFPSWETRILGTNGFSSGS